MLNVARRKIKEFHLNCDTTLLVHIGKENMKELHITTRELLIAAHVTAGCL